MSHSEIPFGFDLNHIVPYSYPDSYFIFTELILSLITWFGTLAILRTLLQSPYNTRFILSLTLADFVFANMLIIFHTKHLLSGGWSSGKLGCMITAGLSMPIVSGSVLSMVSISAERYLSIFHAISLTEFQFGITVAFIWLGPLVIGQLIWLTSMDNAGDYIMLQNGKSVCMANFGSMSTTGRFIAFCYLIGLFAAISWVIYAYVTIYLYYKRANRRKNKANPKKSKLERELLIKCMSLSILFFICWIPFLILIFYMVVTGKQPPSAFTSICATNTVLNSALNPILLIIFDSRIRNEVVEIFFCSTTQTINSTPGSKVVSTNDKEKERLDGKESKDRRIDEEIQDSDKLAKKYLGEDAVARYIKDLAANLDTEKIQKA